MRLFIFYCFVTLSLFTLLSCTPLPRGATEQGFVVGGHTNIAINISPDLPLQAAGQKSITLATDHMRLASARMHYAIFGEIHEGNVTRHAHTFFVTPSGKNLIFSPETYTSRYAITTAKETVEKRRYTVQTLMIPAEGDWFSHLWAENTITPPSAWLGMRWSSSPTHRERIVIEYREPLPPCLEQSSVWVSLQESERVSTMDKQALWQQCQHELSSFTQRAQKSIHRSPLQAPPLMHTGKTTLSDTSQQPDFTHHVGELEWLDNSRDSIRP